ALDQLPGAGRRQIDERLRVVGRRQIGLNLLPLHLGEMGVLDAEAEDIDQEKPAGEQPRWQLAADDDVPDPDLEELGRHHAQSHREPGGELNSAEQAAPGRSQSFLLRDDRLSASGLRRLSALMLRVVGHREASPLVERSNLASATDIEKRRLRAGLTRPTGPETLRCPCQAEPMTCRDYMIRNP